MKKKSNIISDFTENSPFKGLFAELFKQSKLNLHMAGVIRVTSSGSSHLSTKQPHEIINPTGRGDWISNNAPNAFLQIDFRSYLFHPTYYSLSFYSMKKDNRIKSWVMQGSVDGSSWFCLDEVRLNRRFDSSQISCAMFSDIPVRFVRICQIGKNLSGNNVLSLHQIEFFGELVYDSKAPIRLKTAGFM
ncbi:hypothetical protein M9Y10_005830 [Tritrichomonas musculus]|uniref:F5/8 type C domain-containing protein n=1 Tax=Tritrichomonas musculus TaxID=1915356 RepID=A0ABR2JCM8_9EUKA